MGGDWKAMLELHSPGLRSKGEALPVDLIYRACAAAANAGQSLREESMLPDEFRCLIQVRRWLFAGDYEPAERELTKSFDQPLLDGDAHTLRAQIALRRDRDAKRAREGMLRAAEIFEQAGEYHRQLRARINAQIARRELGEYVGGELMALEQECIRRSFHDLAGFILRGRAIELLNKGKFALAENEARRAIESFQLDGCPEDRALAQAFLAIVLIAQGKRNEAQQAVTQIVIEDGKRIVEYLEIYKALLNGRIPELPSGHALAQAPWKNGAQLLLKGTSTCGKLLNLLKRGPSNRHELIEGMWGQRAFGEAYDNRLRVALTTLRKKYGIQVEFDGDQYKLMG